MAQKKSYNRYFIILQEEEKGYSLASDKLPSGYTKLEIKNDKCKISYYVQNLRKERQPYNMILICSKKGVDKIINLGELNIDEYGRTEIYFEYSCENICGSGISVDKIAGAAIVKFEREIIIPIMSGFSSTEIPEWKKFDIFTQSREKKEENEFDKYESKIEEIKESTQNDDARNSEKDHKHKYDNLGKAEKDSKNNVKYSASSKKRHEEEVQQQIPEEVQPEQQNQIPQEEPQTIQPQSENQAPGEMPEMMQPEEENQIPEEVVGTMQQGEENQSQQEMPETMKYKTEEQPPIQFSNTGYGQNVNYTCQNCEHKNEVGKNMGDFFMDIVKEFNEMDNVCEEIKRCMWYKVKVKNLENLYDTSDYDRYTVAYYPMIDYYPYIQRHGHYVLGYKCDMNGKVKYIVYGIPGTRRKFDQPYGGRSGFVTWIPLKPGEEDLDSLGYWLMFYDYRNTTIVVPVK